LWDGLVVQGITAGVLAANLAITAHSLRPGETEFLRSIIRPAAVLAAIPVVWIVFQILPLQLLAHPIWASAEAALGQRITGSISIDPGASVVSLGQYLCLVAAAFLSTAIAVDRGRAESLLFALTIAATAIAFIALLQNFLGTGLHLSQLAKDQASTCVVMGVIIAAAACIRTIERYETRHTNPHRSTTVLLRTFIGCAAALLLCAVTLLVGGSRTILIPAGGGLVVLAAIEIIRRFGLGLWGMTGVAVIVIGVAVLTIAVQPVVHGRSPLLAFADSSPQAQSAITERVLDDTPFVGTGIGTFAAIAPVYREMDDPPLNRLSSTTAATLAIELGRPMLGLIAVAIVASLILFLRASLQRGRDSFYPAMGAGCLVALLLLAFVDVGISGNAAGLIATCVLGLALAQSKSRTAQSL
jgi:hypothetical protein